MRVKPIIIGFVKKTEVRITTTADVANEVGIGLATLERWLANGKIRQPKILKVAGRVFRNWSAEDVKRIKSFKAKNYRKGRGRKPKA